MIPVVIGTAQSDENLTLFPLFAGEGEGTESASWTLLADALEAGEVVVTEVGDGIVGELEALNERPGPVLILDGEQLIGAKQNRTTSRSMLLPAAARTRIPVSCMEQGRWSHASPSMRHGGQHSPSKVRGHARRVEARAPEDRSRRRSPSELLAMAQGEVWETIAESGHRAGIRSGTGALDALYAGRRDTLEERSSRFPLEPGQIGLLAFIHGAPVALDLLPGHAVYAKVHGRLVRAYVFEALDAGVERDPRSIGGSSPEAERGDAEAFLEAAGSTPRRRLETVGAGTYASVAGHDVVGAELSLDGSLVHLSVFNAVEKPEFRG